MVDTVKEFLHIAFQGITRFRVISAFFSEHSAHHLHAFMISFPDPAGKRVWYEGRLKDRIQDAEHRMMENPVAHRRFMNVPTLRVSYEESRIWPMPIRSVSELAVEREEIRLEIPFEFFHIRAHQLASLEFVPCGKQVFHGNYFIKYASICSQ